ncbi:MAG: sortase [Oscillospiraceae bacterium]|nr:sortase [Oscillospiraceae bacterium]
MKQHVRAIVLIVLGLTLICTSAFLFFAYEQEAEIAGENAQQLLGALALEIEQNRKQELYDTARREQVPGQMPLTSLQGYDLMGVIRVPGVGVELPVLNSWNYDLLKLSPCRYSGSIEGQDLILMGHNYKKHFAPLRQVSPGDRVEFLDASGSSHAYVVAGTEVLKPTRLDELTVSESALTIFTCTPGGYGRFVVRCDPIQ